MQSRKDKINSKDITERLLFGLFGSSIMTQIVERVCAVMFTKKGVLFFSDWHKRIAQLIVT